MSGLELDQSPLHGENLLPGRAIAFGRFHVIWIKVFADNVAHHHTELFDSGRIRLPDTFPGGLCGWKGRYHPSSGNANAHGDKPSIGHVPSICEIRPLWEKMC